jgi:hypothetical protein
MSPAPKTTGARPPTVSRRRHRAPRNAPGCSSVRRPWRRRVSAARRPAPSTPSRGRVPGRPPASAASKLTNTPRARWCARRRGISRVRSRTFAQRASCASPGGSPGKSTISAAISAAWSARSPVATRGTCPLRSTLPGCSTLLARAPSAKPHRQRGMHSRGAASPNRRVTRLGAPSFDEEREFHAASSTRAGCAGSGQRARAHPFGVTKRAGHGLDYDRGFLRRTAPRLLARPGCRPGLELGARARGRLVNASGEPHDATADEDYCPGF